MGMLDAFKTIVVPALIAFAAYLVLTFVLVPLWQYYRNRYSHYLPLDTISTQTSSIRQRIQTRLANFLFPSRWGANTSASPSSGVDGERASHGFVPMDYFRSMRIGRNGRVMFGHQQQPSTDDELDLLSDDGVGEELSQMNRERQREHERAMTAQHTGAYNTNRLSRDLEEGFMDDSDDDDEAQRR